MISFAVYRTVESPCYSTRQQPPKLPPFLEGSGLLSNTQSLGRTHVHIPNGISATAVSAGLTVMTNAHTDRGTDRQTVLHR